uniref:VWFD domain-containing protein n=1 Tax=Macrostomum lignano TaxID=282301 RepID=A0A1I8GGG2_9PLAT
GQWHAAAPVGSPVSAVGASSLPLELQLEDPCRASWEAFGSSDHWRPFGGDVDALLQAPVSFIRLSSEISLSWQALNISGHPSPMALNMSLHSGYMYRSYGLTVKQHFHLNIEYFLSSVRNSNGMTTHKFELKFRKGDHGKLLQCGLQARQETVLLEEPLYWEVPTQTLSIIESTALVLGYPAEIWVSSKSFPEAQHHCFISTSQNQRLFLKVEKTRLSKAVDEKNRTVFRVQSKFAFNVTQSVLNRDIFCECSAVSGVRSLAPARNKISEISKPCQTTVNLGSKRYWLTGETRLITVTSTLCSIWNVTHSCYLVTTDKISSNVALQKVQQEKFSSAHELRVTESMTSRNRWKIRCQVNQTGVICEDSDSSQGNAVPSVFSSEDKAAVDLSAKQLTDKHVSVHAILTNRNDRLPIDNLTCELLAFTKLKSAPMRQYIPMHHDD